MTRGGTPFSLRKGVKLMNVTFEALGVMISFASLVVALVSIMILIANKND